LRRDYATLKRIALVILDDRQWRISRFAYKLRVPIRTACRILDEFAEQGLVIVEKRLYKRAGKGRRLLSNSPLVKAYKVYSLTEKGRQAALLEKKVMELLGEHVE